MMSKNQIGLPDKWFYLPIIAFFIYFLIRLVDQAKMIFRFPLDYTNDVSSHMAVLHFLRDYGFHGIATNWYNGMVVLKYYSPAWWFFSLPLYWITNHIELATYISLILMLVIGFLLIWYIGKNQNFSVIKRIAFFCLMFMNPISIGLFIRLMRLPSMFGFLSLICLFLVCILYLNKKIDWKFVLFFSLACALSILSHPQETILSCIVILGLFLVKENKEKLLILISGLIGMAISAFWWIPFIRDLGQSTVMEYVLTFRLFQFNSAMILANLSGFLFVFALWYLLYLHIKKGSLSKKEQMFYLPVIILSVLYATRIVAIIPYLNQVYPESYNLFFAFFVILFLLKIRYDSLSKLNRWIFISAILILTVAGIVISHWHTPYFKEDTPVAKELREIAPLIKERFLVTGIDAKLAYSRAYYSYTAIYYNASTPDGWATHELTPELDNKLQKLSENLREEDCNEIKSSLIDLDVKEVISYSRCDLLKSCGFKKEVQKEYICMYSI